MINGHDIDKEMKPENWYFTFGYGHTDKLGMSIGDRFVIINGAFHSARQELVNRRGIKFSSQYDDKEFGPVQAKYGLKEINLEAVTLNKMDSENEA